MKRDIQFFVNNWIFGAVPLPEIVRRVAAIGFDGIELVGEPKIYNARELKKFITDRGINE
jgi:sugar phosphate isomerase/epimerase